jgi:hypothetical protein
VVTIAHGSARSTTELTRCSRMVRATLPMEASAGRVTSSRAIRSVTGAIGSTGGCPSPLREAARSRVTSPRVTSCANAGT